MVLKIEANGRTIIKTERALKEGETRPPRRVGTAREFLRLFKAQEQVAFFERAASSPQLALWWADASSGNSFSLDHPAVAKGLKGLVEVGVLTPERADEIAGADFDG